MYKKDLFISYFVYQNLFRVLQVTNVQIFIWKKNYVRETAIVLTIILILIRVFLVNEKVLFQRI